MGEAIGSDFAFGIEDWVYEAGVDGGAGLGKVSYSDGELSIFDIGQASGVIECGEGIGPGCTDG